MESSLDMEIRKRAIAKAQEQFARFSAETRTLITEYAVNPAYMSFFLEKLKLTPKPGLDAQLTALSDHADEVGETQFLMKARHQMWKAVQNAERTRAEKVQAARAMDDKSKRSAAAPVISSKREPEFRRDEPKVRNESAKKSVEAPKAAGIAANAPSKAPTPKPGVDAGEYRGPERRKRSDRRSRMDRRGVPEGVAVNKRYERDRRRRPEGRRKSDKDSLM
ncbi:hypothetical protein HY256_01695 [Candidatus Sumerlaeota bacterium]|nr:hypothetical protein [Candidatus Sumerlaeota bacterium]